MRTASLAYRSPPEGLQPSQHGIRYARGCDGAGRGALADDACDHLGADACVRRGERWGRRAGRPRPAAEGRVDAARARRPRGHRVALLVQPTRRACLGHPLCALRLIDSDGGGPAPARRPCVLCCGSRSAVGTTRRLQASVGCGQCPSIGSDSAACASRARRVCEGTGGGQVIFYAWQEGSSACFFNTRSSHGGHSSKEQFGA
jgi:hypothetical protein